MSYVPLASKLVGETITLEYDFQSQMVFGEMLDSLIASVAVTVFSGVDTTASNILTGPVTISGTSVVTDVTGGKGGVIYILTFHAAGSSGAVYRGTRLLAILTDVGSYVTSSFPVLSGDLPDGVVGAAYSYALDITGGYQPYTPAVPLGDAPEWMGYTIVGNTVVCAGTSSTDALSSYVFTVRIQDSTLAFAESPQIVNLTRTTIAGDYPNIPYIGFSTVFAYTASLGTPPYTFTISSGSMPPGLSLDSDGNVPGTVSGGGDYAWTVRATDVNGIYDETSDTASIPNFSWIGSGLLGTSNNIVPSPDGLSWNISSGWSVPNSNNGFLLRRDTDGAVIVWNAVVLAYKFGISFDSGLTFSMFDTVGMNSTGHIVGWSGGYWQCCSNSAATRITDAGVQTQVPSSTGFNTMCIGDNRIIAFKSSRIWHADVTGDNWADTAAMPITSLVAAAQRAYAHGVTSCLVGYQDLGATLEFHAVWSVDNGVTYTDSNPLTIADPGIAFAPHVWYDPVLNLWVASIYNRIVYGPTPVSLVASPYIFPSEISDISSDGAKFIFTCANKIVASSDCITFSEVYSNGAKSAVAVYSS